MNIDLIKKDLKYFDDDYIVQIFPIPYDIISSVLDAYKIKNHFKSIPEYYIKILNGFMENKILEDKYHLINTNSGKYTQQFLYDVASIYIDYTNRLKSISINNMSDEKIKEIKLELLSRLRNEVTGIATNMHDLVLMDYKATLEYINNCEKEFNNDL